MPVSERDSDGRSGASHSLEQILWHYLHRCHWEHNGKLLELDEHMGSLGTWWMLERKVVASSIIAIPSPVS